LHRDISPGNVYLWDIEGNGRAPSAGNEGFIADLELASVPQEATTFIAVPVTPDIPVKRTQAGPYLIPIPSNTPQSPPPRAATPQHMVFKSSPVPPKSDPGPSFTVSCCLNTYRTVFISYIQGTAQFIAKEILDGFVKKRHVVRDVHHDLESFLLVIIYSVYRRFTALHPYDTELRQEYQDLFGNISPAEISDKRNRMFMEHALPELRRTVANEDLEYIIDGCVHFINLQNLFTRAPENRARPDLPKFPGDMPLRQLTTYDIVDAFIRALLPVPSSEEA
jgi:hypothetical protein